MHALRIQLYSIEAHNNNESIDHKRGESVMHSWVCFTFGFVVVLSG